MDLEGMRRGYNKGFLREGDLHPMPWEQLRIWLREAESLAEPNAMILSTADQSGFPSSRTVLLKKLDSLGLVWFTNYQSRKGRELEENPRASVCFSWPDLERQVIASGPVEKISPEENDLYWRKRPRDHQLGSAASPQSQIISSREELESAWRNLAEEYPEDVPLPEYWGGFRLTPERWEFWQGGHGRMHDRFQYALQGRAWEVNRLAP